MLNLLLKQMIFFGKYRDKYYLKLKTDIFLTHLEEKIHLKNARLYIYMHMGYIGYMGIKFPCGFHLIYSNKLNSPAILIAHANESLHEVQNPLAIDYAEN
jgi:hypothetical protein